MNSESFLPDTDVLNDDTPKACPFCGYDGALDYQGTVPDTIEVVRAGVTSEFDAESSAFHCPDCNGRFQMLDSVVEA